MTPDVPPGFVGAAIISMIPDPEDWCCDLCNATIPVIIEDGSYAMIGCDSGDNALCLRCMVAQGYRPGQPGSWSPSGTTCGCEACHVIAADPALDLREVSRHLPEHGVYERPEEEGLTERLETAMDTPSSLELNRERNRRGQS
jgi:hypothetical protein